MRYNFVFRIRPDHMWLRPIPHVRELLERDQHPWRRILLWDDQIAVARRGMASTVLLTPQLAFATCWSEDEWRRACTGSNVGGSLNQPIDPSWNVTRCKEQHYMPCEPMNLLAYLGPHGTSVDHLPLQMRDWTGSGALQGPTKHGEFCIKREQFVIDNSANDCRQNAGCMDC
jgi:hypothetical protein